VELSVKFLTQRFLPDKAIDVLDEVGARVRLLRSSQTPPLPEGPAPIDERLVEEVVSLIARIPAKAVSTQQKDRLKNLKRDLRFTILDKTKRWTLS